MKFQDYLADQMKDPEFAAAYREISTAEDRDFVDALLAKIERMKPVIEAAQKWAALQSVNAITTEDAAIQLVEAVGVYEEKETPNEAERDSGK